MMAPRRVSLVAAREVRERLRGRAIWVATAFTAAIVVALVVIPAAISAHTQATTVGLVGTPAQALASTIDEQAVAQQTSIATVQLSSQAEARRAIDEGTVDVALSVGPGGAHALVDTSLDPGVASVLQTALDIAHLRAVLQSTGVSPATISTALQPVAFTTTVLQPPPALPADYGARVGAAFAAAVLLYVSLQIYGSLVGNGVGQEKTSRTAEVLLSVVRPMELLAGKVAGIGAVGVVQIGTAVAAGLIANAIVKSAAIPADVWLLLPAVALWFVLGYALCSFAYAAAGAIVARQEEVNLVSVPITLTTLVAYLLTYVAVAAPSAPGLAGLVRILSFIPLFSPVLMPVRIALGDVAAWETPVAVLVMLVSIYVVARTAARIYAVALVRGGPRLSWRAALRLRPAGGPQTVDAARPA